MRVSAASAHWFEFDKVMYQTLESLGFYASSSFLETISTASRASTSLALAKAISGNSDSMYDTLRQKILDNYYVSDTEYNSDLLTDPDVVDYIEVNLCTQEGDQYIVGDVIVDSIVSGAKSAYDGYVDHYDFKVKPLSSVPKFPASVSDQFVAAFNEYAEGRIVFYKQLDLSTCFCIFLEPSDFFMAQFRRSPSYSGYNAFGIVSVDSKLNILTNDCAYDFGDSGWSIYASYPTLPNGNEVHCYHNSSFSRTDFSSVQSGYFVTYKAQTSSWETNISVFDGCIYSDICTSFTIYKDLESINAAIIGEPNAFVSDAFTGYVSGSGNTVEYNPNYSTNSYGDHYTNISNSVVNNSSNDTIYNIVNNYYSDQVNNPPSADGGSGGDGGGSGILDLISGIGSVFDLILSVIGNIIELATGIIKQIFDIVTGLLEKVQSGVGSLGTIISDFFPFIPAEIMSCITLGIVLYILVGIIKKLTN